MKTIRGSFGTSSLLGDKTLSLMASGRIRIKRLVSHRVSIEKPEEGFHVCRRRETTKALIVPA